MLFLSLIILFPSLITQKWWDPVMRSLFGFCFQLFLVFVSITQFYDFWVMSYGNWTHFRCFQFQNSVFNGIFIIKHTRRDLLSEQHTWGATFDGLRRFFFFFLITEPIWSSLLFFFFFFVLHHKTHLVFTVGGDGGDRRKSNCRCINSSFV